MTDTRIVYGARCTWWDSIQKVGRTRSGLPACPHCKSVLFETPDETEFLKGVPAFEAAGNPGYGEILKWARGRCFLNLTEMKAAYAAREGDRHV